MAGTYRRSAPPLVICYNPNVGLVMVHHMLNRAQVQRRPGRVHDDDCSGTNFGPMLSSMANNTTCMVEWYPDVVLSGRKAARQTIDDGSFEAIVKCMQ